MVRGLEKFREHHRDHTGAFAVIGGVACDQWFTNQNLDFRATKDVDMVLLVEGKTRAFLDRLSEFIAENGYEAHQRRDGSLAYYRFADPKSDDVPTMIELFSTVGEEFELRDGQQFIPIQRGEEVTSLSAILLDEDYYRLVNKNVESIDGLPVVSVVALIPLKAKAYLDLQGRKQQGTRVNTRDFKKHRNDVFKLAALLEDTGGPELSPGVRTDLSEFLDQFPAGGRDWDEIRASGRAVFGAGFPTAEQLIDQMRTTFEL